jgi:hypothetical protein
VEKKKAFGSFHYTTWPQALQTAADIDKTVPHVLVIHTKDSYVKKFITTKNWAGKY